MDAGTSQVYVSTPLSPDSLVHAHAITAVVDITADKGFEAWHEIFKADSHHRSAYLPDDSTTIVAKLSETRAIIVAFDVNIPAYIKCKYLAQYQADFF